MNTNVADEVIARNDIVSSESEIMTTDQYGLISIDQDNQASTSRNQISTNLLPSNTEQEEITCTKEKTKVSSQQHPSASNTSDKKKKNRTPPKSKYNSNQQQRSTAPNLSYNNKLPVPAYNRTLSTEDGSTTNTNKKGNLNHLLNFTRYNSPGNNSTAEDYEYQRFSKQFWTNKIAKNSYFSKEQFLQANCQFIVQNSGDYSVHLVDPDVLVGWEKIEEIHMDSNEFISCPICLYPPNAGKMTKCGHIFCWPCILHYLSLSDKSWRKCPICYESIYKTDLKSVLQNKYAIDYKPNDTIKFELMFKSKSKLNTIILPYPLIDQFKADTTTDNNNKLSNSFSLFTKSDAYSTGRKYLKIMSKSLMEIQRSILDRERRQLMKQMEEDKHAPEVCFVQEALNLLGEREASLKLSVTTGDTANEKLVSVASAEIDVLEEEIDKLTLTVNEIGNVLEESIPLPPPDALSQTKKIAAQQSTLNTNQEFVYFYQSSDGQRIFLNALNARMMMSEYEAFTNCPQQLSARILASESHFMTEENRKRFRYLSHLPLHSEFKIVEVELLVEEHVSAETFKLFEKEVHERRRLRDRKLMKERRLADKWDQSVYDPHYYNSSAMNESQVGNGVSVGAVVDYGNDFPEASTSPSASSGSRGSESVHAKDTTEQQQQATSFAQMIKHPNTVINKQLIVSNAWPTLDTNSGPPANLAGNQQSSITSGWLSVAKQGPTLGRSKRVQAPPAPWGNKNANSVAATGCYEDELDSTELEYMPAPGYKESFFYGVDETLRVIDSKKMNDWESMLLTAGETTIEDPTAQKCQQMPKKKKKTKQLLFCT